MVIKGEEFVKSRIWWFAYAIRSDTNKNVTLPNSRISFRLPVSTRKNASKAMVIMADTGIWLVFFARNQTGGGISATYDGSVSYIKIGIHEWTSPNWEAPITTNSQGVLTTLHSDVDTAAMIIEV